MNTWKTLRRGALAGVLLALLTSCTHTVLVRPAPSFAAHAFEAALPAAAGVFVDAEQLWREVTLIPRPADDLLECSEALYPLDAREAFAQSVTGTLERLIRSVELTATPLDRAGMEARGLDAVLVVRTDTFNVSLTTGAQMGFEAVAELVLSVSAFTHDGLLLREIVHGNAVQNVTGFTCGTGADALGAAVETAIENSMTELGELIANSPELRHSLGAG